MSNCPRCGKGCIIPTCNRCGYEVGQPTAKQEEAFRLVHIFQCSHTEAAAIIGIGRTGVIMLLSRLRKKRPDLFTPETFHIKGKTPFRFDERRDSQPKMKF